MADQNQDRPLNGQGRPSGANQVGQSQPQGRPQGLIGMANVEPTSTIYRSYSDYDPKSGRGVRKVGTKDR
jgi:hypothetical protein